MDAKQNEEFTAYLKQAVRESERLKFHPNRFKAMLESVGGFEAVNRLLANGKPSEGFTKLWELGRLDLTCEAIVVESRWRAFFDKELVGRAENLLREVRYPFKPFQRDGSTGSTSPDGEVAPAGGEHATQRAGSQVMEGNEGINAFFEKVLGVPVANPRWSWGAVDQRARRVILRLWRMDETTLPQGRCIRVLGDLGKTSHGWRERVRHLELIRSGYAAYAVTCEKETPVSGKITGFGRDRLLKLGKFIEQDGSTYLQVLGEVPVDEVCVAGLGRSTAIDDVEAIRGAPVGETTRESLVDARLGQGAFRAGLLRRWDGSCAVTGCTLQAMLRASHIKPWRHSNNDERLDLHNGLILTANLDALFDAGLISFDDDGQMLVAAVINSDERRELGLPAGLRRKPGPQLRSYLGFHRDQVFRK